MATHFSILAWGTPWTEVPGRLQSMGSQSWARLKQLSMCCPSIRFSHTCRDTVIADDFEMAQGWWQRVAVCFPCCGQKAGFFLHCVNSAASLSRSIWQSCWDGPEWPVERWEGTVPCQGWWRWAGSRGWHPAVLRRPLFDGCPGSLCLIDHLPVAEVVKHVPVKSTPGSEL